MKILGEHIDLREILGEQGGRVAFFGGATLGTATLHPMVKKGLGSPAVVGMVGERAAKIAANYGLPAVEILTGLVAASVGKTDAVRMAGWGVATVGMINGAVTVAPKLKESLKAGFGLGLLGRNMQHPLSLPSLSAISPSAMAVASYEPYSEAPELHVMEAYAESGDSLSDLLFDSNEQEDLIANEVSGVSVLLDPIDSGL